MSEASRIREKYSDRIPVSSRIPQLITLFTKYSEALCSNSEYEIVGDCGKGWTK